MGSKYGIKFAQETVGIGLFFAVTCILIIRTAHLNFKWFLWPSTLVRLPCMAPLVVLFWKHIEHELAHLLILLCIMVLNVGVDFWAVQYEKVEEEHHHPGSHDIHHEIAGKRETSIDS